MEQKKDLTKRLIADSFKELMMKYPFEKITIKMITDNAGIIRPTFYNHFYDKYELLEWIFVEDVIKKAQVLVNEHMDKESVKLLFTCISKDRQFYAKAMEITGQNNFEEVMQKHTTQLFINATEQVSSLKVPNNPLLTKENIATYYALGLVAVIKYSLSQNQVNTDISIDDCCEAYFYLISHSIFDLFN